MKIDTKKLTVMAMLVAISVILVYFIHFPLFPAAAFLEYDPADIPILIGTLFFGPITGLILTVVASAVQALTVSASSGIYGFIMHVIATFSLVLVTGLISRKNHSLPRVAIALLCGTIAMGLVMVVANHFITPHFMGVETAIVDAMLLPVMLPFNLLKAGINSVVAYILWGALSRYVLKDQALTH